MFLHIENILKIILTSAVVNHFDNRLAEKNSKYSFNLDKNYEKKNSQVV